MATYYLLRWEVRALPERGLMRCHLHGIGHGWWGQSIKHKDCVNKPTRRRALSRSWTNTLPRRHEAMRGERAQNSLSQHFNELLIPQDYR